MRTVICYAFVSKSEAAESSIAQPRDVIERWLLSKGAGKHMLAPGSATFETRRKAATLVAESLSCSEGQLWTWELHEGGDLARPVEFATTLGLAEYPGEIAFSCSIRAGHREVVVAPLDLSVKCPRVVRSLLECGLTWTVGKSRVRRERERLLGERGGLWLARAIRDPERPLPLVVVTEQEGFQVHPNLDVDLAYDLAGLATVVSIDDAASRTVTAELGTDWSCYNVCVR